MRIIMVSLFFHSTEEGMNHTVNIPEVPKVDVNITVTHKLDVDMKEITSMVWTVLIGKAILEYLSKR